MTRRLTGLGQCIAAMVAAREFNAKASLPPGDIFGAVTTGGAGLIPDPFF